MLKMKSGSTHPTPAPTEATTLNLNSGTECLFTMLWARAMQITVHKVSMALLLLSPGLTEPPMRTEKMRDRTSKNTESDRESRARMQAELAIILGRQGKIEKKQPGFSKANALKTLHETELARKKLNCKMLYASPRAPGPAGTRGSPFHTTLTNKGDKHQPRSALLCSHHSSGTNQGGKYQQF